MAQKYHTSAKTLNEQFKQTYGQPIYSYFNDRRLNEAHIALAQTPLPMKVLSARLGYSHVNHFINAFTKSSDTLPAL
ncbi:helix-turn-helix transcriptional regulator [Pseudidiomarina halophila]|uniref:helix-turn-helix transcriptional regulator n=1 Tax=Pseudidiomarina halophila TaxID=1449799 RepID=UPI00360F9713